MSDDQGPRALVVGPVGPFHRMMYGSCRSPPACVVARDEVSGR
ncbi:hypothetical protein [Streptomyces longisporoflavus]|nr:hypothetical protein [Streptomyces longisporoflavus]